MWSHLIVKSKSFFQNNNKNILKDQTNYPMMELNLRATTLRNLRGIKKAIFLCAILPLNCG